MASRRNDSNHEAQTRIVKHAGAAKDTDHESALRTITVTPRVWEQRSEAFRGFDSPPGRF